MKTIPKYSALRERLDRETVAEILRSLGYALDSRYRFKLRDEKTPSASIREDGYIKDFGDDFGGDIFDVLETYHDMNSAQSRQYVAGILGIVEEPGEVPIRRRSRVPPLQDKEEPPPFREEWKSFYQFPPREPLEDVIPGWLYKEADKVDKQRFLTMVRYDHDERCLVAGCFDEDFQLIGYKWRRKNGIKWYARKGTHPNRSVTVRTLRTRPGPLHIIEGHRDALTATLLGLNYVMIPTASFKPTERALRAIIQVASECGGRPVKMWAEDKAAYKTMRPLAERLGKSLEVELDTYPGGGEEKVDLADLAYKHKSKLEILKCL